MWRNDVANAIFMSQICSVESYFSCQLIVTQYCVATYSSNRLVIENMMATPSIFAQRCFLGIHRN